MPMRKRWLRITLISVALLLAFGLFWTFGRRPVRQPVSEAWFQGVTYERIVWETPRPVLFHLVTIDLTAPGIGFVTTAPDPSGGMDLRAQTVLNFARDYEAQIAINASYFSPFHSRTPFDYYPHAGDPVDAHGLAIANGIIYSDDGLAGDTLCINGIQLSIQTTGCPPDTQIGLSSFPLLLQAGTPEPLDNEALGPRTAVALDAAGTTLWLLTVDGRQPRYSEGVTLAELAAFLAERGAADALNFDGGGSTTLVAQTNGRYQASNAPIHTRIPMRLRPVANHLGVFAAPLP
ncbi:MAG: phosphodiester glycosidase family protein [Anaerolineales bacterium]|nr:phosphodiester glycosidase family protein [Anaerolineales bacterium]